MSELIGPALPPGYGVKTDSERDLIGPPPPSGASESPEAPESGFFGPQLPTSRDKDPQPPVRPSYGPALPPGLVSETPCGPFPPHETSASAKDDEGMYIRTYIHTYIHTCIHTYTHPCIRT